MYDHISRRRPVRSFTLAMARNDGRNDLYPQLLRRMVEHGEYDRLFWVLTQKLNESGWLDDFRDKSKEMTRNADKMSVETIITQLRPQAEASIAPKVKLEVLTMIRQYLEKQVEG
ncbi:transcription factor e(y)2-domain-containing protein [Fomitopsis serialis]|uniref:transcription factor e(y)2-domain-containing protein n=1 Tax=Fomitopsis serialis TaxID=139415 RepID=UPI0020081BE4|nr:transcription factor e(y)2-domain-containing protein [Neoantrodia serialis]KAH9917761.1 transcription factor e(y)2-domain-containing protein [Neoantrodia serialis]